MKKIILLCLLALGSILFSETYRVADIKVNGLKRTKRTTVLNIIDVNKGDEIEKTSLELYRQKLLESGIFTNEIEIELDQIDDKNVNLLIELEDKWTLIPLPFFSFSEDSFTAGGIFIESNLLGLNQSLVAGVIYSDEDLTGFAAWSYPELKYGSLSLSLSFNSGKSKTMDFYGNITEGEDNNFIAGGPSYTQPISDNFNLRTSLRYRFLNEKNFILYNFELTYKDLKYSDTFTEGIDLKLSYNSEIDIEDSKYLKGVLLEGSYSYILLTHLFLIDLKGGYNFDKDDYYLLFGAKKGSLVIPKNMIRSDWYSSGQLSYELKIVEFSWGYLTLPLFFDIGVVQIQGSETYDSYYGPGAGMNLYMKKVAVPAMGIFYVYDIPNERYNFTFSIGASF